MEIELLTCRFTAANLRKIKSLLLFLY